MKNKTLILVPSSWSNEQRGDYFEQLVAQLFRQMQFKVTTRVRFTGMEIDLLAEDIHSKEKAYIECKFLSNPFSASIISKLVGNAFDWDDISRAYLVTTAEPGKDAKGKLIKYEKQDNLIRGVLRFAYIGSEQLGKLFLEINQFPNLDVRLAEIDSRKIDAISSATLLLTPDEACWVLEQ